MDTKLPKVSPLASEILKHLAEALLSDARENSSMSAHELIVATQKPRATVLRCLNTMITHGAVIAVGPESYMFSRIFMQDYVTLANFRELHKNRFSKTNKNLQSFYAEAARKTGQIIWAMPLADTAIPIAPPGYQILMAMILVPQEEEITITAAAETSGEA
jgi:hypothetical protein